MSTDRAEELFSQWLKEIGVNAEAHPELDSTPRRFTALARRWLIRDSADRPTIEPIPAPPNSGRIVIRDIAFHSWCVHHLVPFFGRVHVVYDPAECIVGFGSVPRLVGWLARGPRLQEDLVNDVRSALQTALSPAGLVVACEARQMCMELTGATDTARTLVVSGTGTLEGNAGYQAVERFLEKGSG